MREPDMRRPFFYCGPLATWAMRNRPNSISLLIAEPNPLAQTSIDAVSAACRDFPGIVGDMTGASVDYDRPIAELPVLYSYDLIYCAGESAVGHKNFAHFFPLEAGEVDIEGRNFTVVFANVVRERLANVTRRIDALRPRFCPGTQALETNHLLSWFRAHDLGHFLRIPGTEPETTRAVLTPFARACLDEAIADATGLLTSGTLIDPELPTLMMPEIWRYAARDNRHFADSAAATILLGYMCDAGVEHIESGPLADYLGHLLQAMYRPDPTSSALLRNWHHAGVMEVHRIRTWIDNQPTDHTYVIG
ncbi:hypothetical protein ACW2Q0_20875 [Nocardia sp. R16R-3T]